MTEQSSGKSSTKRKFRTPQASRDRMRAILYGNRFRTGLFKQILIYALLIVLSLLFLLPFYWMVNTSLKTPV